MDASHLGVDVIVRGEGDVTFREVIRAFEAGTPLDGDRRHLVSRGRIPFHPHRGRVRSRRSKAMTSGCPIVKARALDRLHAGMGRPVDVVETSRGCTFDCSFCSIIEMRGRNFHRFSIERVIADIAYAKARGARAVFLVDDNITLDVLRFQALCEAIITAGLKNDLDYLVQGMTASIASPRRRRLHPLMPPGRIPLRVSRHRERARRGSDVPEGQGEEQPPSGGPAHPTPRWAAVNLLRRHGMLVVGGLIVGNAG